ncbi:MAG: tetratricopeptide repeat protein [Candidatus Accumulibacter sp.]|jgi:predicted O-linked N-acetylglucosamine transferase (SPINDLY family)|nr:tetratricopeptide repeat protein [Accumulibacter sp.]
MASDPARARQFFNAGLEHHRAGRFAKARACYERGLRFDPGQPDALFLLGEAHFCAGNAPEGERLARRAIAASPRNDAYRRSLAIRLFNAGHFSGALTLLEEAVRLNPSEAANHSALASTLERLDRADKAIARWHTLLELAPDSLEALRRLAALLTAEKRVPEALEVIERWLKITPEASAYALRADLNESAGNDIDSILSDRIEAAARAPNDALSHGKLALALLKAGRDSEALEHFDESVRLAPESALLHFNRGRAYARLGDPEKALPAYEAAVRLSPESAGSMLNLANLYSDIGREDAARTLYARILAASPKHVPALFNLGMLHLSAGRRKEAAETFETALAASLESEENENSGLIAAHLLFQKMHLCEWDGLEALTQRVIRAIETAASDIPPFIALSIPGTTPELQRKCAATHSSRLGGGRFLECPEKTASRPSENRRLRVGYLSSDFKAHATSWLMIEMLEAHDRSRFEIFALSHGTGDGSAMRDRVERAVEHFIDLAKLPEHEAVARIAALELDMLIDLKGYTDDNRAGWLRYRLAPVQATWLGYPGTLGAPWVDCLIADARVAPPENAWMFSERLVHLPGSYQPNCRARDCAPAPERAAEGLPENALVLCSFNQAYKITPEIFAVWLDVLREFPETALWLWESNRWAADSLRRAAETSGVVAARLVFAEGRPQAEHLARLRLASLALDTFPCNGHTTTSDALWAGVPVVTLQGEAFASRVAGSLLHAAGLPELVAANRTDYGNIIRRFCRDAGFRASVSTKAGALRENSDIFDSRKFARKLETCFEELCRKP